MQPAPRPKKRLGQHFLKDPNTARIVATGVGEDDVVLEIGPGRGFLTTFLAEQAKHVHAVELDPGVLPALHASIAGHENVRIHEADALAFDYSALDPSPNRLAANLPYNIASPLVLKLLEEAPYLKNLRFMVQLEVARRMAAGRGTKDYGAYAVLLGLLAEVRVVHRVPPTVFDPPPRVYSAVVDARRRDAGLGRGGYGGVKDMVLAAFASRRKRLVNNLPREARDRVLTALNSLGFGPDVRAEELAPGDFVALYRETSGRGR